MRILLVVHGFPPVAEGGTEVYAHAHARAFEQGGDEVVVLTREQDPAAPEYRVRREERDGLSIVWVNNTFRNTRSFEESYRNPAIAAIARQLIDEFRPDVAHVHHLTCLSTEIVGLLADRVVPCIFTLHDYWLMCHRGQLLDLNYRVCDGPGASGCANCLGLSGGAGRVGFAAATTMRGVLRRLPEAPARVLRSFADRAAATLIRPGDSSDEARRRADHMRAVLAGVTHFLAPSQSMRDRFVRFGVAPDRITTVGYGVDHAPFRAAETERTPSNRLRLGFLGTMMVSKAPHLLLEAFSRLPPGSASVDLFGGYAAYHGDDSYRALLESLTALDSVRAHGAVGHDQVAQALRSIDVLVVPSIWPENSPFVIREAFLSGVPVVGSNIGGIPELIEDGRSGLLFRPGDVDDLHRVLTRLLEEPELLPALRAGIPTVRSIEEDATFTRRLYEAHRSLLGAANQPPPRLRRSAEALAQAEATPYVSAPATRRVAAIVLNYRTPDDTWLAVRSLLASRRKLDEVIVVNNDAENVRSPTSVRSPAGVRSPAWFSRPGDDVTVIDTVKNLGFSAGMNAGIRAALDRGATHVLLVNSDAIVPPDCLARLEQCLDNVPGAGIAGPVVVERSDPARIESLGMSYAARSGRMRHQGFGDPTADLHLPDHIVVDAIAGCLMLIRREVFAKIGFFDEDYFFAFEDLDLCLKARAAGFAVVLAGSAKVYHEGGRSIGADSPRRLYFAARNHLLVARRSDPTVGRLPAFRRASSIVALNLAHASSARGGSWPARIGAVMRGARDYFRGRFGDDTRA